MNNFRSTIQKRLSEAIKDDIGSPVFFGNISKKKMNKINDLRAIHGLKAVTGSSIYVYPNVIKKLRDKRVHLEKLTPDQVADIAFSAVHNTCSKIIQSKYPQIQALIKSGTDLSNLAFIGEYKDAFSIKSSYNTKNIRAERQITGNKKTPRMDPPFHHRGNP